MQKNIENSSAAAAAAATASTMPTAPPATERVFNRNIVQGRTPPPSYEETMRMQFTNPRVPCPSPGPQYYAANFSGPFGVTYAPVYGIPPQYQQVPVPTTISSRVQDRVPSVPSVSTAKPVLTLARGATVQTVNGAISIPPPPPGVAPTPAQLAAMNGEPVLVKQQKRGFF